ncbi:hypothetical protein TRIUR3_10589 [Triticum urartu]|uniref:Uncharacterized protein n=1 Tax=Triticum urartu TaxID=4572 RepID=M8B5H1_TRIUA|nr:hypothetical protein TRIUR3_10589 [Triticum urartu]
MEYCETKIEMEERFPVEYPWKLIRGYKIFCIYHGDTGQGEVGVGVPERAAAIMGVWGAHGGSDAGWGEDGIGIPERAAARKGAWGAHGGQWEGFELG